MLFDTKNFNGEVFDAMVRETPNLRTNELLKSRALVENNSFATQIPDAKGGHYATTIIKDRIGGDADNYDGSTDITTDSRGNYTMGRIVIGRAHGWTEKDFSADITGDDYMPAANEVAEYFDDLDQDTLLSTLKGIYSMTGTENLKFVNGHTYDISANTDGTFGATTLNNAMQKALGDRKNKFALAIMHSQTATTLENLKLLEYLKYTDAQGIERPLPLASLNGRLVLVDDTMPTENVAAVYAKTADTALDSAKTYYTRSGSSGSYVYTAVTSPDVANIANYYEKTAESYVKYTTYVLGEGAIEYTNCPVKVPSEMDRNILKNGGETTLVQRQRKIFAPFGISWNDNSILSPTNANLEAGTYWDIANDKSTGTKKYYPIKDIAIARVITRG